MSNMVGFGGANELNTLPTPTANSEPVSKEASGFSKKNPFNRPVHSRFGNKKVPEAETQDYYTKSPHMPTPPSQNPSPMPI